MDGKHFNYNVITTPLPEAGTAKQDGSQTDSAFEEIRSNYYTDAAENRDYENAPDVYDSNFQDPNKEVEPDREVYERPEAELNPERNWRDTKPGEPVSDEVALNHFNWRLTGAGYMLDAVYIMMESDEDKATWDELKKVVFMAKQINDPYVKIDFVIAAEQAVWEFTHKRGATYEDYLNGRE